ncbi:MAG: hypothetical protein R2932_10565 [Caldilineaceae bacterium]
MPTTHSLLRAASNVLTRSLDLRSNQHLLIIADLVALPVVDVLTEVAFTKDIEITALYIPRILQHSFHIDAFLPDSLLQTLQDADAILSCLDAHIDATAFRLKLLEYAVDVRRKVVHAPGLTIESLQLADTDYDEVNQRCMMLARAFLIGRNVEIVTQDCSGNEHKLTVQSEQWDIPPGITNGIINAGGWANFLPGETFILPKNGQGEIVINGSLPGRVLAPGEELLLRFIDGHCVDIASTDDSLLAYFEATQVQFADAQNDTAWRTFAELGFGVNAKQRTLTGIPLIDEKIAGTLHVALGRNDYLGGPVYSVIHCDLVATGATVRVDGHTILEGGRWAVHEADWLMDYRVVQPPEQWWQQVATVRQSGTRSEERGHALFRICGNGRGRTAWIAVGNDETAQLARRLYELLPKRETVPKTKLVEEAAAVGLPSESVAQLLWLMSHYDLVRFEP